MVWLQPWGEGEQEHCEVSMGVMEDTGPQVPTPTRPPRLPHLPSPSGPPSWPHLLLAAAWAPISCSHLRRHWNKGGFRQSSCQDLPHEVCKAAPERAHRPCWPPVEDATPSTSMSSSLAPPPDHPIPATSTLSPCSMIYSVSVHSLSPLSALQPPEPFLPLDRLSPWPRAHSPSTSCPPDSETHPPTPTASSAPQSADSILTFAQCDSMALPQANISELVSTHPLVGFSQPSDLTPWPLKLLHFNPVLVAAGWQSPEPLYLNTLQGPARAPVPPPTRGLVLRSLLTHAGRGCYFLFSEP